MIDLGSAPGGWLQVAAAKSLGADNLAFDATESSAAAFLDATSEEQAMLGLPGAAAQLQLQAAAQGKAATALVDDVVPVFALNAAEAPNAVPRSGPSRRQAVPTRRRPIRAADGLPYSVSDAAAKEGLEVQPGPSQRYLVIGVDRGTLEPVPGALTIRGDMTDAFVQQLVMARMKKPRADVGKSQGNQMLSCTGLTFACGVPVLSDMAHSFTGNNELDHGLQMELAQTALTFATQVWWSVS